MKNFRMLCTLILLLSFQHSHASGTVVGNGGDPLFEFVEAARSSMIDTIKLLVQDPNERQNFCKSERFNDEQLQFCQHFFMEIAPDILRLAQGQDKTLLTLKEEKLLVEGPDGKPMQVSARTELGPNGPIEIHRDSLKTMTPVQVLFLLTHEFQHKAQFEKKYVSDNERVGPFSYARDLLDTVALSVVDVAKRKGKIGNQFGIRDIFDCIIQSGNARLGVRTSSARMFLAEDLMSYQTSVGRNPLDGALYIPENFNTEIHMRFVINEPNNCGETNSNRKITVQILRKLKKADGTQEESVLKEQVSSDNPMCSEENSHFAIQWDNSSFQCEYYGSEGVTSSPFRLRNQKLIN